MALLHRSHKNANPVPMILESPLSGTARLAGTGIEVFEIVRRYQALGADFVALQQAFHWLTREQLHAALEYYTANPHAIDAQLRREAEASIEAFWDEFPRSRPRHR